MLKNRSYVCLLVAAETNQNRNAVNFYEGNKCFVEYSSSFYLSLSMDWYPNIRYTSKKKLITIFYVSLLSESIYSQLLSIEKRAPVNLFYYIGGFGEIFRKMSKVCFWKVCLKTRDTPIAWQVHFNIRLLLLYRLLLISKHKTNPPGPQSSPTMSFFFYKQQSYKQD